jgi:hypothetical protein
MDNNILACEFGLRQLSELAETNYKIDLNQGIDARLVGGCEADILAKVKWLRFIQFSCDTTAQLPDIERVAELLLERGINTWRMFVYLLVTADIADAAERVERLKRIPRITLYAQPERNAAMGIRPNALQMEFAQRYIYSGVYRRETWAEYLNNRQMLKWLA